MDSKTKTKTTVMVVDIILPRIILYLDETVTAFSPGRVAHAAMNGL